MHSFSIPGCVTSWTQENIMLGQLSRQVVFFCFTRTNTVHGDYLLNPLHLQHFNITFFSLYLSGRRIPTKSLQPNLIEPEADYMRSYMQMHSCVGTAFRDDDNAISYTPLGQGSTVFVFDLTADLSNDKHTEPTCWGTLRAKVHFGMALAHPITCFVYSEYGNCIEIDADRKISLDYLIFLNGHFSN